MQDARCSRLQSEELADAALFVSASRVTRAVRSAKQALSTSSAAFPRATLSASLDGLRRGGERRMTLQRDPHALVPEPVEIVHLLRRAAEHDRQPCRLRNRIHLVADLMPVKNSPSTPVS